MAKLRKVKIDVEDGCVDSVGGIKYTYTDVVPDDNTTYTLIVTSTENRHELTLSGRELQNLLKLIE